MTVGSQLKQTLASLKGSRATLRIYAEQSQHEQAVHVFSEAVKVLNDIIVDLETRIRSLEFFEPQYKGS